MRIPSPALVVLVGPSGAGKSTWAAATFAAGEVVERFGALEDAGIETAIVRLADLGRKPDAVSRFAEVIAAFGDLQDSVQRRRSANSRIRMGYSAIGDVG